MTLRALAILFLPLAAHAEGAGMASYYVHGGRTASGEMFNPHALTAAHKTLPFGTLIRVVRSDGRAVTVRITDRMGHKGRVLDLSLRAARVLGMQRRGVVWVAWRRV